MRRKLLYVLSLIIWSYSGWSQCNTISTFPYLEDFDGSSWTVPLTLSPCWTASPAPSASSWSWLLYTGNSYVGSRNTGVSSDVSGSGNYLFAYSDPAGSSGQTCQITSPSFDLTSLPNPSLEFAYHMFGTNMGKLEVEVKAATGSWTLVDSIVGSQQTTSTAAWAYKVINLSAFNSSNTEIRLIGYYGSQSAGDINIDEFRVYNDTSSACGPPVNFQLVGNPKANATFTWSTKVLDSCEILYGPTGFIPGNGMSELGYGDSLTISGLSSITTYDAYLRHYCNGDTSLLVGPITFTAQCEVATAPYNMAFSLTEYGRAFASPFGGYAWTNCWTQQALANQSYWVTDTAGGPFSTSPTTGPDFDNTNFPNSGGGFMVLKASNSSQADLTSTPLIDISGLQEPVLTFAYYMYGADIANLRVDVWDGAGWSLGVWSVSGQQQTSGSDPWKLARIPLSSGLNSDSIRVRFHATGAGTGEDADIAIDDLFIGESTDCGPTANAVITNISGSSYEFDASGSTNLGTVEWLFGDGSLASGQIVNHTFQYTGLYEVTCIVLNACDTDTLKQNVNVETTISLDGLSTITEIQVYPNPSSEKLYIEFDNIQSQSLFIQIIATDGRIAYQSTEMAQKDWNRIALDLSQLPRGLFQLRLQATDRVHTLPIIIEK